MIRQLRTRLAPTPSGYLHLGNAWSFLLTWLYARKAGGYVHLRIDDIDPERYRDAYAEDIFTSLKWLGLDHDGGPATVSDFFSQRRTPATTRRHHAALDALCDVQSGAQSDAHSESAAYLFECQCSRERIKRDLAAKNQALHFHQMNAIYPGTCRHRRMQRQDLWPGETDISVLRWHLPESTEVLVHDLHLGNITLFPGRDVGDAVVRTRSGGIAYHLASIADDEALHMNFIVRGEDLLASTGLQLAMARHLRQVHFPSAVFVHHPLMTWHGRKLSKSEGADSLKSLRERGVPVTAVYRYFAATLGLPQVAGNSLATLLQYFPGASAVLPRQPLEFERFEECIP